MPLFSWFASLATPPKALACHTREKDQKPEIPPVDEPLSFEGIADKVESLQHELAFAHELCEQANLQFDKYRVEIGELKTTVANQQKMMSVLRNGLTAEKTHSASLRAQYQECQIEMNKLRFIASQSQARAKMETAALNSMTRHAHALEQQYVDTRFDLEYLKCVTNAEQFLEQPADPDPDVPLPPQPFVVVLVDGDAYRVSLMLSTAILRY